MPPWWPKIKLKFFSTTIDKIITSGQILVFEVSKRPHWSLRHYRVIIRPFWDYFGTILGPFWDFFGTILGLFWDHFGKIFGPFWDNFGTILEPFCNHFWTILGPSLLWPILTYFDLWGPILTLNWVCFVPHLLLLKRGRRRPEGPEEPWEPEGPPSSLQELEGGARSSPNF